jgi:endoglucanase
MKLKKLLALSASAVMAVCGLAGCSSGKSSSGDGNGGNGGGTAKEMRDISSWELVKELKYGWNLGNTMDATGNNGLSAETAWQSVKTNPEMMALLAKDGFNVVRIPVSWGRHMDKDYKVDEKWMARVREIVDYGIDNGLYVILNTHHEEWYFPNEENKEQDKEQLKALWEQIAEEFKDYDEHLIFEGLNEPRLRDTANEWNGGTAEARQIVAEYEKVFYDTVRNSGGNNAKRHLMMTGYAASSDSKCLKEVYLPENDDKIIVSVHAYIPYNFALNTKGTDKYSGAAEIKAFFKNLKTLFIDKQIPVIVGEYGAMNKNDNTEARVKWITDYLTTAKEVGVPCIWWDNNSVKGNGEKFGLMNRANTNGGPSWRFPEIIEAIKKVYA